jgi:hypothetical protein
VSRNTVRKVIRSGATAFTYERNVSRCRRSAPWRDELDAMLAENARASRSASADRIRIFEDSAGREGYAGGYDAVRRYAAGWSKAERHGGVGQAYVPLSFAPGEAYQFDWSHESSSSTA